MSFTQQLANKTDEINTKEVSNNELYIIHYLDDLQFKYSTYIRKASKNFKNACPILNNQASPKF